MESYGAQGAAVHAPELGVARHQRRRSFGRELAIGSARPWQASSSPAAATSRTRAPPRVSCAPCTSNCPRAASTRVRLELGPRRTHQPLIGDFNVDNLLTVIAMLLDWELTPDRCRTRWRACTPRRAAWRPFGGIRAPLVVVDYAHTPDGCARPVGVARALPRLG
jgi:hypothetical protein